MISMILTITIVDPALDALHALIRDNDIPSVDAYNNAVDLAAREYLATVMPSDHHHVSIDDIRFLPAHDNLDAAHEIECTLEP